MQLTLLEEIYNTDPKMSLVQSPNSVQENLPLDAPVIENPRDESTIEDDTHNSQHIGLKNVTLGIISSPQKEFGNQIEETNKTESNGNIKENQEEFVEVETKQSEMENMVTEKVTEIDGFNNEFSAQNEDTSKFIGNGKFFQDKFGGEDHQINSNKIYETKTTQDISNQSQTTEITANLIHEISDNKDEQPETNVSAEICEQVSESSDEHINSSKILESIELVENVRCSAENNKRNEINETDDLNSSSDDLDNKVSNIELISKENDLNNKESKSEFKDCYVFPAVDVINKQDPSISDMIADSNNKGINNTEDETEVQPKEANKDVNMETEKEDISTENIHKPDATNNCISRTESPEITENAFDNVVKEAELKDELETDDFSDKMEEEEKEILTTSEDGMDLDSSFEIANSTTPQKSFVHTGKNTEESTTESANNLPENLTEIKSAYKNNEDGEETLTMDLDSCIKKTDSNTSEQPTTTTHVAKITEESNCESLNEFSDTITESKSVDNVEEKDIEMLTEDAMDLDSKTETADSVITDKSDINASDTQEKCIKEPEQKLLEICTENNSADNVLDKSKEPITLSKDPIDLNSIIETTNSTASEKQNIDVSENSEKPNSDTVHVLPEILTDNNSQELCNSTKDASKSTENTSKELEISDRVAIRSMLANNMVIFSDEEDEPSEQNKSANDTLKPKVENNRECVSLLDDDDDIMCIDDDTLSKNEKPIIEDKTNENKNTEAVEKSTNNEINSEKNNCLLSSAVSKKAEEKEVLTKDDETGIVTNPETKTDTKPLVAADFLKNFKNKMSEMNKSDLEEFCLLKIVEGVIDRSNLSEIKAKLKTMAQNVEEWKKKAMVLNKQNRDLQIVLRTVQEEQKKKSYEAITPLKITRSVGMQVLMTDPKVDNLNRSRTQKRAVPSNTPPVKLAPKQPAKNAKNSIPVPRLVPASSPAKTTPVKSSPQLQNSTVTSNSGTSKIAQQNIRPAPVAKVAEKRSFSDAIDLTDDEPNPPAKKPPVRLVPSQQLMAPGRSPIVTPPKNSNPRQVFIPIGPQGNIRPGQSLVFKNGPQGIRPRGPNSVQGTIIRGTPAITPRATIRAQHKHPAPLPQSFSQPQPPNWKALPPAPDLKISKIENGIVVSWKIDGYQESSYEEIVSYQLYAYQETSAPASTVLWNKIGDIKALPLPMACTLTQFIAGYKYYFAVRAVDIRSRIGPFSLPGSILLLNK